MQKSKRSSRPGVKKSLTSSKSTIHSGPEASEFNRNEPHISFYSNQHGRMVQVPLSADIADILITESLRRSIASTEFKKEDPGGAVKPMSAGDKSVPVTRLEAVLRTLRGNNSHLDKLINDHITKLNTVLGNGTISMPKMPESREGTMSAIEAELDYSAELLKVLSEIRDAMLVNF